MNMKKIIFLVICALGLSCGISKSKNTLTVLVYDIYFADHFDNDTIDLFFNDTILLQNCRLDSKPYDLTRVNIKVYQNNEHHFAVVNETDSFPIKVRDMNELELINKNYNIVNTNSISETAGKYIIYRGDDHGKIRFVQTDTQPGFD